MKKILIASVVILCLSAMGACRKKEAPISSPASHKKMVVVTTLFPLYDFARTVGGNKVDVNLILPPGIEAHSFEPKPEDAARVTGADLFVYTNEYMEPWAVKFVKGLNAGSVLLVDSSKGVTFLKAGAEEGRHEDHDGAEHHHAGGMDPHIWLDFGNAQIMVDNIAEALAARDPANKGYYLANAAAYKAELKKLDDDYKAGLSSCAKKTFLHGGHYAFGYLAHRYGLQYESASAVNADAEPTPAKLIALVKQVKAMGLKYVYSEELLSPRVSEMIAKETGATVLLLHGAHNISKDDFDHGVTFIALMRRNLDNLRAGLQCK
ncbi:metal ABC transporter substrate-binding protein [Geobacter sp. AOG2]|uniref:metal ABC transporter substrate-binding protein n=1 Tax=Geobacter sp. AOG2 TaxID=1566347 RepID=UPI001CC7628F|nr:metal ABC transporter substrate-binding protein [Geobacter sp. AOG2]GFE62640.1 periplasmic divalent manganese/zinc-binding lipoprotein [Geobacter sp. AOG2]